MCSHIYISARTEDMETSIITFSYNLPPLPQVNAMMNPHQAGSGAPDEKKGKFYHAWELEKQQAAAVEAERRKLMQRRRKAMGGKTDDDEDDGSGLPEGWPTPVAADVAMLLAMEMPSQKLPKHHAGDVTYHQQQQLSLDMAEIPDEGGWSGLTRPQVDTRRRERMELEARTGNAPNTTNYLPLHVPVLSQLWGPESLFYILLYI